MKKGSFSEAEAFLALADQRGFGSAARELGVTQSTISRRIAMLETRIGQRLVERTTRRVVLTEAGTSYAGELRDIMLRLENADARVQSRTAEAEGLLRVTMSIAFGRTCVAPALIRLAHSHPRLRFELDFSDRYVDLIDSGFDVAVRLAAPPQSGIDTRHLGTSGLRLCASPDYVKTYGLITAPEEIATRNCLAFRTYAPRINWSAIWQGQKLDLVFSPRMILSDMTVLHTMVSAGLGIAVLPQYFIESDLAKGTLVDAMPGLILPNLDIFAAYPRDRVRLRKVAVLLDELRNIPEFKTGGKIQVTSDA